MHHDRPEISQNSLREHKYHRDTRMSLTFHTDPKEKSRKVLGTSSFRE
jgi:hypothetical protein